MFKVRSLDYVAAGVIFLLVLVARISTEEMPQSTQPPHIIFILADDLGWNDVSFHGSSEIPTPNIDALAATSIILNNYYSEALCTPSRAALMTGKYPIHLGLQQSSLKSGEPVGLPLDIPIMPEHLKNKGYATHIIGKWHLGYSKKEYTPTSRGFDSFFGFYNEQIDYFDYTNLQRVYPTQPALYGIDLQDGTEVVKNLRGQYATEVFTDRALDIISNHNESLPLFLFLSHLAPHSGNEYMPLQAPLQHIAKFKHISDKQRRTYAGMVSALDESVGRVVSVLGERGFLQNSLIAFASDNGGAVFPASNWPLRGGVPGPWEGALRVNGLLWSAALEPRTSKQLMHVSDWLPTFYEAAGGDVSDLGAIDGVSLWDSLRTNSPSPRIEILHSSVLRRGDYKLVVGPLDASGTVSSNAEWPLATDEAVFANGSLARDVLQQNDMWTDRGDWRRNATVSCGAVEAQDCVQTPCLFNVAADPCEMNNVAPKYPRIVRSMLSILNRYNLSKVEPLSQAIDLQADPRCFGFAFVSWLDNMSCDCPFAI